MLNKAINFFVTNPWSLVLLYYVIKLIVKFVIIWGLKVSKDFLDSFLQIGPDLCFMGFTLFAAAILDKNSGLYKNYADVNFAIMAISIFFIILYFLSFVTFRYQKKLDDEKQEFIKIGKWVLEGAPWVIGSRIMLVVTSLILGIYSYTTALDIWLAD